LTKEDQIVKEILVAKGKVEAFLSIFSKIGHRIDYPMLTTLSDYGATLISPIDSYIERLNNVSAGAVEILQRRLADVRRMFSEAGKETKADAMLRVFEQVRRLYDDLELTLTAVGDVRRRDRSSKV
jgi:CelD/BcsL family acetyltransferase involved in cellulose biosynthesis